VIVPSNKAANNCITEFPVWREIMVSAMCLCADKGIISLYSEDLFSRILMLPIIFRGLIF
jgi:hypothetical protein